MQYWGMTLIRRARRETPPKSRVAIFLRASSFASRLIALDGLSERGTTRSLIASASLDGSVYQDLITNGFI